MNKFTEEQYEKLVKIKEERFPSNLLAFSSYATSISEEISELDFELYQFISEEEMWNQALALMNPATREWAHERFVEKEKRYVWRLKSDNDMTISKASANWYLDKMPTVNKYFAETEIENSPFKPEWFDKEEV